MSEYVPDITYNLYILTCLIIVLHSVSVYENITVNVM